MKLASFDIFDTALIRKCGRPENLFFLLSRKLFPDDEAMQCSFYMWRIQAEQAACKRLGKTVVTLHEIYGGFDEKGFLPVSSEIAIQSEKGMESAMLTSNKEVMELIALKRSQGFNICFISDMYIGGSFLKDVLVREGCATAADHVFVSCDYGKTKAEGSLYDEVKSFYGDISLWQHYGDNKQSDYLVCRQRSINAKCVDTSYSKTEQYVESEYMKYPFGKEMSVLIGMQRCGRLHTSVNDVDHTNAADFVASLYIPYLFYVFNQARQHHIQRLYFLSRDSYLLYKMALTLSEAFPEIECRYLFLSRQSLALPMLNDFDSKSIGSLMGGYDSLIGFETEQIIQLLQLNDLRQPVPLRTIKNKEDEIQFLSYLAANRDEIDKKRELTRSLLHRYFQQEGLFDGAIQMAMVDVGWFGSTRLMINRLRSTFNLAEIPFFYLGCRDDVLGREYGKFYSYLPPEFVSAESTYLIEAYYSASFYPSTIGYHETDTCVKPVFGPVDDASREISLINTKLCVEILKYVHEVSFMDFRKTMDIWGCAFISLFSQLIDHIDYSRLKELKTPDGGFLIESVSPIGLLRYFYEGHTGKACLQKNSVYSTYRIKWSEKCNLKEGVKWLKTILH